MTFTSAGGPRGNEPVNSGQVIGAPTAFPASAMKGAEQEVTPRLAARVLLVDAEERVLMFRGCDPTHPDDRHWFTVGGGVAPRETTRQAAARELREETGLSTPEDMLGTAVWSDVTEFSFNGLRLRQTQDWFLLRTPCFEASTDGWDEMERRTVDRVRWWSADELDSTDERFYPAELPALLRRLLSRGED